MKELWLRFRNPYVRTLAWAIGSPSLLSIKSGLPLLSSTASAALLNKSLKKLEHLDKNPEHLTSFIQSSPKLIGLKFESFWLYSIQHIFDLKLIAHNLQLIQNGTTLGALDFIIERNNEIEHWEVAIKLYLGEESVDWTQWIGPNGNDNLGKKISKMSKHQLPLIHSPFAKSVLSSQGIKPPSKQMIIIKGFLFRKVNSQIQPKFAESDMQFGKWEYKSKIAHSINFFSQNLRWIKIDKKDWLIPISYKSFDQTLSQYEFIEYTHSIERSTLFAGLLKDINGDFYETTRLFVVPDKN